MSGDGLGFTQMPNVLWDLDLTIYERGVLGHIVRKTIGWGKTTDGISLSQFVDALGVSKDSIIRAIKSLKSRKIISVTYQTKKNGGRSFNQYGIHQRIIDIVNNNNGIEAIQKVDGIPSGVVAENDRGSRSERQGVVAENDRGSRSERHTKDTSTKDTNTNIFAANARKKKKKVVRRAKRFIKPTLEDVMEYCKSRDSNIDPVRFFDSNEMKGWVVGKAATPMKDWKAAVRLWEHNNFSNSPVVAVGSAVIDDDDASWMEGLANERF